jgi:hypothetical protein
VTFQTIAAATAPDECEEGCLPTKQCICHKYDDTCTELPDDADCVDCGDVIHDSSNLVDEFSPCAKLSHDKPLRPERDYSSDGIERTIPVYIQDIGQTVSINVLEVDGWYCLAENGYKIPNDPERRIVSYFDNPSTPYWLITAFLFNRTDNYTQNASDAVILGWPKARTDGYLNDQDVCMQKAIWRHWVRKITFDHFYEAGTKIPDATPKASCDDHPGYHLNLMFATVDGNMTDSTGSSGSNGGNCDMVNYIGISAAYDQKYGKNNLDDFDVIAHEATHSWQDARWTMFRDAGAAITWSTVTWINARVKEWAASLYWLTFPEYYYLFVPPYGKVFARNPFVTDNGCEIDVDCECIKGQDCNTAGDTDGDNDGEFDLEDLNCEDCYTWAPEDPMPENIVCSQASCNLNDECGRGVCTNGRCSERTCNIQECVSHADCPGDFVCNAGYCQEYKDPNAGIWTILRSPGDTGRFDCHDEWFVYDKEEVATNGWTLKDWEEHYSADRYLGRYEIGSVLMMLQVPWQVAEWPNMHEDFPIQADMFGRNPYSGVELDIFPSSVVRKALLHAEAHLMDSMTNRLENGGYESSKHSPYSFDAIDVYLWFYKGFRSYVDSSWNIQKRDDWRKSVDLAFASIGIYSGMEKCDLYSYSSAVLLTGQEHSGIWDVSEYGFLNYLSNMHGTDSIKLADLLLPPKSVDLRLSYDATDHSPYTIRISENLYAAQPGELINKYDYECCLPEACPLTQRMPECGEFIHIPVCTKDYCISQNIDGVNQTPKRKSFSVSIQSKELLPHKHPSDFKNNSVDSIKNITDGTSWYYWKDESSNAVGIYQHSIKYNNFFMIPDDWSQVIVSNRESEQDAFYRMQYTGSARLPMVGLNNSTNTQNIKQDIAFNYCVCKDSDAIIETCRENCKYSDRCIDECLVSSCTNCDIEESMYNTYEAQAAGNTTWKYLHPACPTVGDCSTALSGVVGITYHGENFSSRRVSKEFFWNWYDEIVKELFKDNSQDSSYKTYLVLVRATYQSSQDLNHGLYFPDRLEYDANHFQFSRLGGDYKTARLLKPLILETPHEINHELEALSEYLHPRKEWFFDYQISNPITDIWIDFGHVFEDNYRDLYFPFGFQVYTVDLNRLFYEGRVESGVGQQELNHTDYAVGAGFDASGNLVRYVWGGINREYLTETGRRFPDNENHAENGLYMVRHHADTEQYTYMALHEPAADADGAPLGVVGGHVFYYNPALTEENREDSEAYAHGKVLVLGGKTEPAGNFQTNVYTMELGAEGGASWTLESDLSYRAAYSTEVQIGAKKFLLLGVVMCKQNGASKSE